MEILNQGKAAKFLEISEGYLSKILSGKSSPRPFILKNISKITETEASLWLFGTREEKEQAIKSAIADSKNNPSNKQTIASSNTKHKAGIKKELAL